MSLIDDLAAANQKISDDTSTLANDTAARDAIQAAIDAASPHLALLDAIEADLAKIEDGLDATIVAALDTLKTSVMTSVEAMRKLFLG